MGSLRVLSVFFAQDAQDALKTRAKGGVNNPLCFQLHRLLTALSRDLQSKPIAMECIPQILCRGLSKSLLTGEDHPP